MVLRKATISIIIGVLFGIFAYVFMTTNPNLNMAKLRELIETQVIEEDDFARLNEEIERLHDSGLLLNYLSPNFYVGTMLVLCSIFSIFFGIHIIFDKLFFKKFFEKPDIFDAVRRGILLCIAIALAIYFKLLNIQIEIILALPIIMVLIEYTFLKYFKNEFVRSIKEFHGRRRPKSVLETQTNIAEN